MRRCEVYGRLCIVFPPSFAYPAMVQVRASGVVEAEYRRAMQRGAVGDIRLTDDELDWLIGFDDDVANHDVQYDRMQDRYGSR